jgi:copper chaperone CopZ
VALVFLKTGPATNAATIMTIWRVMGRRTALVYLASVAGTALAAGLTLDYIFHVQGVPGVPHLHDHHAGSMQWIFAVALLAVLAVAVVRSLVASLGSKHLHASAAAGPEEHEEHEMTTTLQITGMTCDHCRQAVQRALAQCKGVKSAAVDLKAARATVTGQADLAELLKAVEGLGYQAKPAE